jgi:hypothetical protein
MNENELNEHSLELEGQEEACLNPNFCGKNNIFCSVCLKNKEIPTGYIKCLTCGMVGTIGSFYNKVHAESGCKGEKFITNRE